MKDVKHFANFPALTSELAFDLIDRLAGLINVRAKFGMSNKSCSSYVNIEVEDEDGDYLDEGAFKVRFSDHADRYGADLTFRIDDVIETIEDEDGDYIETTIEGWRYAELLDQAVAAVAAHVAKVIA